MYRLDKNDVGEHMRCSNNQPGALALAFGAGIIIPIIFPDRVLIIFIALVVIILAYIMINCCR